MLSERLLNSFFVKTLIDFAYPKSRNYHLEKMILMFTEKKSKKAIPRSKKNPLFCIFKALFLHFSFFFHS